MAIYFISDLHLDDSRPDLINAFCHYLNDIESNADALYILGDFFEAWIGDDDDAPWIDPIVKALHQFSALTPVYIMHGNRDFMIGEHFCDLAGCELIESQHLLSYKGRRYLLMHGDELCVDDHDYQAFRIQVRDPAWQSAFLDKPLPERRLIAKHLRESSEMANDGKDYAIMDVNAKAVSQTFESSRALNLIHGHTHRPAHHNIIVNKKSCNRYVLGDWDKVGWHFILDGETAHLSHFALKTK